MQTATMSVTVMPRHGWFGITRSKSKLEVDECIAASLREDDGAGHEEPRRGYGPARQARDSGFQRDIAQRPVRDEEEEGDNRDLQNLARGQDCIAARKAAEHSGKQAIRGLEVRGAEVNPRD